MKTINLLAASDLELKDSDRFFSTTGQSTQVAEIVLSWHRQFESLPTSGGTIATQDILTVIDYAKTWILLRSWFAAYSAGDLSFSASGRFLKVRSELLWNLEALDVALEPAREPLPTSLGDYQFLRRWFADGNFDGHPARVPLQVRRILTRRAMATVDAWPLQSPPDTPIAPLLSLGQAHRLYSTLSALGSLGREAILADSPEYGVIYITQADLCDWLIDAEPGIPTWAIDSFVEFMTYSASTANDASLTPIIPVAGEFVALCHTLFDAPHLEGNLLRRAARDRGFYGTTGKRLGAHAENVWAKKLSLLSNTEIMTNIKLLRPDGSDEGDLDVVAIDRLAGVGVVMEVKNPIFAVPLDKAGWNEKIFSEAMAKHASRSDGVDSGALTLKAWPSDWPNWPSLQWYWIVATPNHIPSRQETPYDVCGLLSLRLFDRATPRTLTEVGELAWNLPVPIGGEHFQVGFVDIAVGRYSVSVERLLWRVDPTLGWPGLPALDAGL